MMSPSESVSIIPVDAYPVVATVPNEQSGWINTGVAGSVKPALAVTADATDDPNFLLTGVSDAVIAPAPVIIPSTVAAEDAAVLPTRICLSTKLTTLAAGLPTTNPVNVVEVPADKATADELHIENISSL
jgi:hypothetical protein